MWFMIWLLLGLTTLSVYGLAAYAAILDPLCLGNNEDFVAGPWMFRWVLILHLPAALTGAVLGFVYNFLRFGWEGAIDFVQDECEFKRIIPCLISGHR